MIFLDLFAGIGGFALAAYNAGLKFDMHLFSEINREVIRIYQSRFPEAVNPGNIQNIKKEDLPDGEYLICGGFPCQDISNAGRKRGLDGPESKLWFEMLRIIRLVRPRVAIVENVPALAVRGLDRVLRGIASIGYDAEWEIISARDAGAPHLRERLWIVAYPHRKRREKCNFTSCLQEEGFDSGRNFAEIGKRGEVRTVRHTGWGTEPAVCRVADGLSPELDFGQYRGWLAFFPPAERRARLTALGNSIVPQCAEVVFQQCTDAGFL